MEILDDVPVELDIDTLLAKLRIDRESKIARDILDLIDNVAPVIRPKAIYEVSFIQNRDYDTVDIGGVIFKSRVLRANLDKVERVFPYVATCGTELETIAVPPGDLMKTFCLDMIKTAVLGSAIIYLTDYLTRYYALGNISHMNPGSLESWPITQQKALFSLFGNVDELIGVRLTEGSVMFPLKSVSGIYFPTETTFESCQLCMREKCIGRRAPYDAELAKKYQDRL